MLQSSDKYLISAVIPVYNDRASLEKAIPVSLLYLERITPYFELIIAEDASTDGSYEVASAWAQRDIRIRVFHRDERRGRGSALSAAARKASGEILFYTDVDLATDMSGLSSLVQSIADGNDIATGSRLHPDSLVIRSFDREMKSRVYNLLVRFFLRDGITDHQCGFKAFRRKKLLNLLSLVRDTHWFWDTEIIVLAQRSGYSVAEIQVNWVEGTGTTVVNSDILSMVRSIIGLWYRLWRDPLKCSEGRDVRLSDWEPDRSASGSSLLPSGGSSRIPTIQSDR